jgi:hypothetical protein
MPPVLSPACPEPVEGSKGRAPIMQGARRANIPATGNRLGWAKPSGDHRATPRAGHRLPNADVFAACTACLACPELVYPEALEGPKGATSPVLSPVEGKGAKPALSVVEGSKCGTGHQAIPDAYRAPGVSHTLSHKGRGHGEAAGSRAE